ncbi:iron transporter [Aliikangiella coralliicola]|uniref:Uncharacterized protein n=1 Tax=Aliikangiella coralliicola TaxID=2592383 RepID=A0A545UFJ0_9GAMM|nr:iron transporter [Aliikangiella coralliicola]TQV88239.1 hypothetical protein FLL46_06850 [Aliikangiella coralliicola]
MKRLLIKSLLILGAINIGITNSVQALEMIIGESYVKPGIDFIFEGAIKDHVMPLSQNLAEGKTDVHIEARVNWSAKGEVPKGTPRGGFIPYLKINAEVINQRTKETTFVTLTPHINLIDNFHYARNMSLPGKQDDKYTVTFYVDPPEISDVSLHKDWVDGHQAYFMKKQKFTYQDLDFEKIAKASRR